jgi:hypothetical protein
MNLLKKFKNNKKSLEDKKEKNKKSSKKCKLKVFNKKTNFNNRLKIKSTKC